MAILGKVCLSAIAVVALAASAYAAAPGISGTTFNLTAQENFLNQPDGAAVYAWGYGCASTSGLTFVPAAITSANCSSMQVPGPTLIVKEGDFVTVTLTNNLPASAGPTSILFPGFAVASTGGAAGLLTQEAAAGNTVTYTFIATTPGTHSYYSGTQGDLQIEMGLYGALIVLPKTVPATCTAASTPGAKNLIAEGVHGESDFRLTQAAYNHTKACYDREYLFQFSEMDPKIHTTAFQQVNSCKASTAACSLSVPTEPYHPSYFMINGRSMPDDMDANYAPAYPHQPYNGNPHMHPGEQVLIRVIGQGRWQHPFHEHANHVRILARDGNLILSQTADPDPTKTPLAGPLMFTTSTTPGLAFDGIFYYTGKGLNWDLYGHNPASSDPTAKLSCTPDASGYNTADPTALNYFEWCQDHNKPLQTHPTGDVAAGGPVTLPDPNILTNGNWYSGSPYLGPNATTRATGTTSDFQPSNTQGNAGSERGYAFMWHSHNEREITTNNIFPGGMMMMMLVDSREFVIDEAK